MKVTKSISTDSKSTKLGTPPPQMIKCGILTLDETPIVKPLKLSSVRYRSPLGNIAKPKKRKKSKSEHITSDDVMPIEPLPDVPKREKKSSILPEQETADTSVIVIPDTPKPMKHQTHPVVDLSETPNKSKKKKSKKQRIEESGCDVSLGYTGDSEPTPGPSNTQPDLHSDDCTNVDLGSSVGMDDNDICQKKKKKHKRKQISEEEEVTRPSSPSKPTPGPREPTPGSSNTQPDLYSDDCTNVDLGSSVGMDDDDICQKKKKKHKRKQISEEEEEVTRPSSLGNDPIVDHHSPPRKKRKVLFSDNRSTEKCLTVSIPNDTIVDASSENDIEALSKNITIDLELDSVECLSTPDVSIIAEGKDTPPRRKKKRSSFGLSDTIVLSDGEDSNDIIVLGSPVVPSIRTYKETSKSRTAPTFNPGWQPWSTFGQSSSPGNVIARAVSRLTQTVEGTKMMGNTIINQIPPRGIKTTVSSKQAPQTIPPFPAKKTVSSKRAPQVIPPSPANAYGSNLYNPSKPPTKKCGLRPVIIDGSNIAMGHGNGRVFSCRGIEICVKYFEKKGHKVFAFVPQFRRHNHYTKDAHILESLSSSNTVIFTPSRYVNGKQDVPYDDRYIVQTAAELGGVIVSTDNYRDLLNENTAWHDVIKNRLLMFTWVEDLLIFPQDPLGRRGPNLDAFLRFPK